MAVLWGVSWEDRFLEDMGSAMDTDNANWNVLQEALGHLTPAEKLRLIEEAARSLQDPATSPSAETRRSSAGRLRQELAGLPVHNPADGFSNRDHDDELYGGRS